MYFPELIGPLLRTLLHLTTPVSPQVILSYKIRSLSKETPFWSAFGLWFAFTPVLVRARSEGNSSRWERFDSCGDGEVFLFVARRRSESFSWIVPEDDVADEGRRMLITQVNEMVNEIHVTITTRDEMHPRRFVRWRHHSH